MNNERETFRDIFKINLQNFAVFEHEKMIVTRLVEFREGVKKNLKLPKSYGPVRNVQSSPPP